MRAVRASLLTGGESVPTLGAQPPPIADELLISYERISSTWRAENDEGRWSLIAELDEFAGRPELDRAFAIALGSLRSAISATVLAPGPTLRGQY